MPVARVSSCFPSTRRPLGLPSTSPRPHRSSKHCALPHTSLLLTGLLAAADTTAARRREPSPVLLPPIAGHQIGSGRAGCRPPTFPWPRPATSSPKFHRTAAGRCLEDPIAELTFFLAAMLQSKGSSVTLFYFQGLACKFDLK
jgi:hypothetical protein